jgi:transposase
MPLIYSLDLRHKAVSAYEKGEGTQTKIAARFSIGLRTLQEWLVLKKETGSLEPKEYIYCGRQPIIENKGLLFIKNLVEGKSDILISELINFI